MSSINTLPEGQPASDHLSEEDLAAFVERSSRPKEAAAWISHLTVCKQCRTLVAEVSLSQSVVSDVRDQEETATALDSSELPTVNSL